MKKDVVVIGGGAAGLSAGLVLARARRDVVVIDAGEPRNAPAAGVHGLLGHDGMPPRELLARGRAEVEQYGGGVRSGAVVEVAPADAGFTVELADGTQLTTRKVVVATGAVDVLPEIAGVWDRWGRDVLHCPYCHGWEVRDQAIGVIGSGPLSLHQVMLFRQWSADLTWFVHDAPTPTRDQLEQLAARGVRVVETRVAGLDVAEDRIVGLSLADATAVPVSAVVVGTRVEARVDFLTQTGLVAVEHPSGMGTHLPADPVGRTTVPGLWVAGNVVDVAAQVGAAGAAGAMTAAQVNMELFMEDTAAAVAAAREAEVA